MGNKSNLQSNNAKLQEILTTALGLPTQDSVKNGQYVWKKYDKAPKVKLSFSVINGSPIKAKIFSTDIDVSTIDESFFTGIKGRCKTTRYDDSNFEFIRDGVVYFGPDQCSFVYNKATHEIQLKGYGGLISMGDAKKAQNATFLGYVVSDNPTAYPNQTLHNDGCWYEKDGARYGLFTVTSERDFVDISHNLGCMPVFACVMPLFLIGGSFTLGGVIHSETYEIYSTYGAAALMTTTGAWNNGYKVIDLNVDKITFRSHGSYKICIGTYFYILSLG